MVLSDEDIREALDDGTLTIEPEPGEEQYDPTSVDLTLHDEFLEWSLDEAEAAFGQAKIDISEFEYTTLSKSYLEPRPTNRDGSVELEPREFLLAQTRERVGFSDQLAGRVEGKSSLARLGLSVHFAPTLHASWEGHITLELHNVGPAPLVLQPEARICQLLVEPVADTPAASMAGTRFQDQDSPRGAAG